MNKDSRDRRSLRPRFVLAALRGRGRALARTVIARAPTPVQGLVPRRSRPTHVPIRLILDGGTLLTWQSPDPTVQELVLRADGAGRAVSPLRIPRQTGGTVASGQRRIDALDAVPYAATAVVGGRERPTTQAPAVPSRGTRNVGHGPGGVRWDVHVSRNGPLQLVPTTREQQEPGILNLEALHGLVRLRVGPLPSGGVLELRRRGSDEVVQVQARGPAGATGDLDFVLGAQQWAAVSATADHRAPPAIWNVHVRCGEGAAGRDEGGRLVRLGWSGSDLLEPRAALRVRATRSWSVAGRNVTVRPYWTRDQFLALETMIILIHQESSL